MKLQRWAMACVISLGLSACGSSGESGGPQVVVYKSASCDCCKRWVQQLRNAGFSVQPKNVEDRNPVKSRLGVPAGMGSCHTAEVGGYFVEGHVPVEDIQRLLATRPDAKGLAVPGMPTGSPGMEVPSGEVKPYQVLLVSRDGTTSVFARHGK